MLYLDTSLLVAALTDNETGSATALKWLEDQAVKDLHISEWVITEFSSALSNKMRTGDLDQSSRNKSHQAFQTLVRNSFSVLPIVSAHFLVAAQFAEQHDLGLRAADALHLAVARDYGLTVCAFDRQMIQSAMVLGIPAVRVDAPTGIA